MIEHKIGRGKAWDKAGKIERSGPEGLIWQMLRAFTFNKGSERSGVMGDGSEEIEVRGRGVKG